MVLQGVLDSRSLGKAERERVRVVTMTKRGRHFFEVKGVTPSATTPGGTNLSDAGGQASTDTCYINHKSYRHKPSRCVQQITDHSSSTPAHIAVKWPEGK